MRKVRQFHKQRTDRRIKVFTRILLSLMTLLFGIVLYDSFVHSLPFYYILFWFSGLIIGRIVAATQKVFKKEEKNKFTITMKPTGIIFTIILFTIRFFAGVILLEEMNVIWATDALYLLFVGIYFSRRKDLIRQIDEEVYAIISDLDDQNLPAKSRMNN